MKNELKSLIASGKEEEALERISSRLENVKEANKKVNEFILISGAYAGLKHEYNLGFISSENWRVEKNRIKHRFLNFIDEYITDNDISIQSSFDDFKNKIQKNLLSDENYLFDFFLCYSTKDSIKAKDVYEYLRGLGLSVFISEESLKISVGESYFEKIQYALSRSRYFILFATNNSWNSKWVKIEYESYFNEVYAKDTSNRYFFILKDKKLQESNIPLLLRHVQFAQTPRQIIESLTQGKTIIKSNWLTKSILIFIITSVISLTIDFYSIYTYETLSSKLILFNYLILIIFFIEISILMTELDKRKILEFGIFIPALLHLIFTLIQTLEIILYT